MIILPEQGACFVCVPKVGSQTIANWLTKNLRKEDSRFFDVERLHDYHATLSETENTQQLPFSIYDMWSFAFVRNPFDRFVSYCAYTDPEFDQFPLESIRRNLEKLADGLVDRWGAPQTYFTHGVKSVFRLENLSQELPKIAAKLGITDLDLKVLNSSARLSYPRYFDSTTKALLTSIYEEDLETFGYTF